MIARLVLLAAVLAVLPTSFGAAAGTDEPVQAWIRVTDLRDDGDHVVICAPFPAGGVTLIYTHSMYGGDVRERFVAADRSLRRVEMTTANPAAAEYYAFTATVTQVGPRYRVDVPPESFPSLIVRVDNVGHHRLVVGDRAYDLLVLTGQAHRVRLDVWALSWTDRWPGGLGRCW